MADIRGQFLTVAGILIFVAAGLAFTTLHSVESPERLQITPEKLQQKLSISEFIRNNVNPDNIRSYLRFLTSQPHIGGTEAELLTAEWVAELWRNQGLDDVAVVPYDVLLSYPDPVAPNMVRVVQSATGTTLWESHPKQDPLYSPEEGRDDVPFNFNGYSAPGNVTAELVYVHYGRETDFEYLNSTGVTIEGRIVLARYGQIFRANIADLAEKRGALGLILFSDPADYAPRGTDQVYPDTVMMPPSAAQLGTVKLVDGDPLTPFYPAIESAFRIPEEEAAIPKIPVQPISYEDAWKLFNSLGGNAAPAEWQGGLNITYRIGPSIPSLGVNLDVHTSNQRVTVRNVVGTIRGSQEPDRYVVLGNHRDAWIFGAIDPSSGTAAMMELSRVLMAATTEIGWRPRRTLVFCSWAAEEYGLVGSMEWVEQFSKQLQDRAVAYLNVDMAIEGNFTLRTKSAPLLYDVIYNATKQVPNPDPAEVAAGRTTVYDTWLLRRPDPDNPELPEMLFIGSGSDYKGFQHNLGVPCLDVRYTHDSETLGEPLYHTLYETFALVDQLYDQNFSFHSSITKLWGQITVEFSDAIVLPMSLEAYVSFISDAQAEIVQQFGQMVADKNLTFEYFLDAGEAFNKSVQEFEAALTSLDTSKPMTVRAVNDRMMMVERSFIDPRGLPDRPEYNHVVFAPSSGDAYAGTAFSGLTDALNYIAEHPDDPDIETTWRQFEKHLAAVTHLLYSAGAALSDKLW
ncbi:Transferrin receptor-like dimerization domain [Trinorchestia longiramus]|nr:Transferrin receptor-like dimerization domain [Trinorchestia longiramus]